VIDRTRGASRPATPEMISKIENERPAITPGIARKGIQLAPVARNNNRAQIIRASVLNQSKARAKGGQLKIQNDLGFSLMTGRSLYCVRFAGRLDFCERHVFQLKSNP
jgi:hypothetical protein